MTIRTRLTAWYSVVLLVSLILMAWVLYHELVEEPAKRPDRRHEPARELIEEFVLAYGVPSLLLVLGGGWFLTRKALAQVAVVADAAERIHVGNLGERVPESGSGDELDRLAGIFNSMLERIEGGVARIREFTLHASHELKTPLTLMRCDVEELMQDGGLSAEQRNTLAGHLEEIQRLARIVDQLSLLTKADSGLAPLAVSRVPLAEITNDAVEDARVLGTGLDLTVDSAIEGDVEITGDRQRLRQMLLNLVANAVHYNHPGGSLRLALEKSGGHAVLTITNTGPGIPETEIPLVFERFYRGPQAPQANADGSGLGLAIVHWIVTRHGGTIRITSAPDEETSVTVKLPLAEACPRGGPAHKSSV